MAERLRWTNSGRPSKTFRKGKGWIFSICGDAGTGKSRLVEEFKATLDLEEIQWLEGHAYAYSQNIPYFPLIDLLNRVFHIEEGDPSEKVREKVESGIGDLVGEKENVIPYIGSLYSLSYPEIEEVSPEFWKSRLQDASLTILSALARRAPTIYLPGRSSLGRPLVYGIAPSCFVRSPTACHCSLCLQTRFQPLYHPTGKRHGKGVPGDSTSGSFSFGSHKVCWNPCSRPRRSLAICMRFVQDKVEGNPFYLEELVNSLIETETLIRDNGGWKVTRSITETDISLNHSWCYFGQARSLGEGDKESPSGGFGDWEGISSIEILKRITELKQRYRRISKRSRTARSNQNQISSTGSGVYVQAPSDPGSGLQRPPQKGAPGNPRTDRPCDGATCFRIGFPNSVKPWPFTSNREDLCP